MVKASRRRSRQSSTSSSSDAGFWCQRPVLKGFGVLIFLVLGWVHVTDPPQHARQVLLLEASASAPTTTMRQSTTTIIQRTKTHHLRTPLIDANLIVNKRAATAAERTNMQTKQQSTSNRKPILRDNLISTSPEKVWDALIQEGAHLQQEQQHQQQSPGIVMEVGMHRPVQCLQAASAGLEAHCVEPSPQSFQRVQQGVRQAPMEVQERVHLYNVAAGSSSTGKVPFTASGGTGDHVGGHNMWKMEADAPQENTDTTKVIEIPSRRLDDIIQNATNKNNNQNNDNKVFLLKVDTQGFEPAVFSGLQESLQNHNIQYILTEYWPRGMDLLAGKPNACIGADFLQRLVDNGYQLYAMPVQAHPKAPAGWKQSIPERPLEDLKANCQWYFDLEQQYPSEYYRMGYWSDVLAVAPGATLSNPVTDIGRALV